MEQNTGWPGEPPWGQVQSMQHQHLCHKLHLDKPSSQPSTLIYNHGPWRGVGGLMIVTLFLLWAAWLFGTDFLKSILCCCHWDTLTFASFFLSSQIWVSWEISSDQVNYFIQSSTCLSMKASIEDIILMELIYYNIFMLLAWLHTMYGRAAVQQFIN